MVCKSSLKKEPNKIEVFREFIGKYGKPICYIGNSDYDMEACKKLKIPSILATWDKVGGEKEAKKLADYVISNPKQIRKIIEDIEESRKSSDFLDPENRRFSRK
jgi:phosphoglycolate phosphatase-like HAD superfamily hydrolase